MAKREKNGLSKFWQPASFLIAIIILFLTVYTSAIAEDIKLFAVNLAVTGLLAVYVIFVIRPKI